MSNGSQFNECLGDTAFLRHITHAHLRGKIGRFPVFRINQSDLLV